MANPEEAIVGIPVVIPPIEVEVTLAIILVEIRDVAVTIDLADGALCDKSPMPLSPECYAKTVSNS